jgi:putative transposase
MNADRRMYLWRTMSDDERREILADRKRRRVPWHGPAHFRTESDTYLITAACFEHKPYVGTSPARMAGFERELLEIARRGRRQLFAWTILPNHYHFLIQTRDLDQLTKELGQLHGRTSYFWNLEDSLRGRQIWHRCIETGIKSEAHFWATLNYILHNAVRHGYVERWQDWPFSNAAQYLEDVGREEAERRWNTFPVLGFGDSWDPPEL